MDWSGLFGGVLKVVEGQGPGPSCPRELSPNTYTVWAGENESTDGARGGGLHRTVERRMPWSQHLPRMVLCVSPVTNL